MQVRACAETGNVGNVTRRKAKEKTKMFGVIQEKAHG